MVRVYERRLVRYLVDILPFNKIHIRSVPFVFVPCCRLKARGLELGPCPAKLGGRGVWSCTVMENCKGHGLEAASNCRLQLREITAVEPGRRSSQSCTTALCQTPLRGEKLVGKSVGSLSATKQLAVVSRESLEIERQREGEKVSDTRERNNKCWMSRGTWERGLQRDVVYLSGPIAPLIYEPKCGGGVAVSQPMRTALCTSRDVEPKKTLEI